MKRLLLLALCVFGVTVAQAITQKWDWKEDGGDGRVFTYPRNDKGESALGMFNPSSIVASFTLSSEIISSGGTLFSMTGRGLSETQTQSLTLEVKDGQLHLILIGQNGMDGGNGANDISLDAVTEGDYTFAFTKGTNGKDASGDPNFKPSISVNGGAVVVFNHGTNYNWAGDMTDLTLGEAITDFTIYNGRMTDGELMEYSVPEPTALALLALGVAGLALRRRSA